MYNRIVSLAPSNTEVLFALGVAERVVGRTYLCDYPPEAQNVPKISSWIEVKDLTAIEKLNPNLILTSMFVPAGIKEWCEKSSVRLVNVYPQTLEDIYSSIVDIGKLVEKQERANEVIQQIKTQLKEIEYNKLENKTRVYCEEWHQTPTASANWVPELVEAAGGTSFAKKGILSHETKLDQLKDFDPEIIILHWCGFGNKSLKELVLKRDGWKDLEAVKKGNIFCLDDTFLNRPGPRIWVGAKLIQESIKQI